MWEDLVIKESKGRLSATELVWHPDARVPLTAYENQTTAQSVTRRSVGSTYLCPRTAQHSGALLLHTHNGPDGSDMTWVSPYMPSNAHTAARATRNTVLYDSFASVLAGSLEESPLLSSTVDAYFWDALGAGSSTQIAMSLLAADTLFRQNRHPEFLIAASGVDLLAETAKLRALRIALDHLAHVHGQQEWTGKLLVVSSTRSLSAFDSENNMVRTSISGTAGLLGGADFLSLQPWNVFQAGYEDAEASDLSLNLFHLLCDESQLDKVQDPVAGSYSVEKLTEDLVQAGWDQFNELREMELADVRAALNQTILPADIATFSQSGRHELTKTGRTVIGETHFTDSSVTPHGSSQTTGNTSRLVFPFVAEPEFDTLLSPGGREA